MIIIASIVSFCHDNSDEDWSLTNIRKLWQEARGEIIGGLIVSAILGVLSWISAQSNLVKDRIITVLSIQLRLWEILLLLGFIFAAIWIFVFYRRHTQTQIRSTNVSIHIPLEIYRPITDAIWISSARGNRQSVDTPFLSWDRCTILLWVLVPRRGEGLRNAPHNKYIIAHQTGEEKNSRHFNAFFFRYSSNNTWDFVFSNPQGEIPPDSEQFRQIDGLEPGWHQIQITWNQSKPLLTFLIDGGDRSNIRYKSHLNYWPREQADSVYVGAWVNPYSDSYCETKIAQLWICNKDLEPTDALVQEHHSIYHS